MGIRVEPIEPCYDADCHYAAGEYLTWWPSAPVVEPPPSAPEPPSPATASLPPVRDIGLVNPPPVVVGSGNNEGGGGSGGGGSQPPGASGGGATSSSPTSPPITPPPGDNPIYSIIGSLLAQRPSVAEGTPILLPPTQPNPFPVVLVAGLVALGVIGYAWLRR